MPFISASACSLLTPGARRPNTCTLCQLRAGVGTRGTKISEIGVAQGNDRKRTCGGSTPTTVYARPSRWMGLPMIPASPPNRLCQSA
jgi:hypothetical protein